MSRSGSSAAKFAIQKVKELEKLIPVSYKVSLGLDESGNSTLNPLDILSIQKSSLPSDFPADFHDVHIGSYIQIVDSTNSIHTEIGQQYCLDNYVYNGATSHEWYGIVVFKDTDGSI